MGGASIWHWIVVGLIVVLLFRRSKISEMMGDVAKDQSLQEGHDGGGYGLDRDPSGERIDPGEDHRASRRRDFGGRRNDGAQGQLAAGVAEALPVEVREGPRAAPCLT